MPFIPKVPDSCEHLDLVLVEHVLAKHHAYFPAAASELGVLPADLKRLTWAKPHLLDEAHEEMELVVARAWGELIRALYSDDPWRQMWACDKIMSSWLARDHPFAPARGRGVEAPLRQVAFRWADQDPAMDELERDVRTIVVPRYDDDLVTPPASPMPSPPPLPKLRLPGPHALSPLVAGRYAPEPFREADSPPRSWRRPSRGGYR